MSTITVRARVATTHPVAKYPGWRLSVEVLNRMAAGLLSGNVPMMFDHDPRTPLTATCIEAEVVPLADGNFALDALFEVEKDGWSVVADALEAAGVPGGDSFSASHLQRAPVSGQEPMVMLAVDAAAWSDADRETAGAMLDAVVPTETDRLFQFTGIELATVYLVLGSVGLSVLGNAAYDAIKYLVARRRGATRIEVVRTSPHGETVRAIITTNDPDVARAAIESLPPAQNARVLGYELEQRLWVRYLD